MGVASNARVGPGFHLQVADVTGGNYTSIAELHDISGPGSKTKMVSVLHQSSPGGVVEKRPSSIDNGDFTFEISYVPTDATHNAGTGLIALQQSRAVRNWKVINDFDAIVWSGRGYVSGFVPKWPEEAQLTAAVTLTIDGPITVA
jgi:hypothetical protein